MIVMSLPGNQPVPVKVSERLPLAASVLENATVTAVTVTVAGELVAVQEWYTARHRVGVGA